MKATFNDFIAKAPNYKKFDGNSEAIHIFENILSDDKNIIAMIDISEAGKPALCACLSQIENFYQNQVSPIFDLRDNFTKQALGTMVRVVLEPFGYLTKSQKDIPKSFNALFVTSAMTYTKSGPATMRVTRRIEEI
ncbi:hypothetical protein [Acetobacterium wieringae]|jgi:hypothetical protein|uniref:Uncharacterized protein n=1 Tax=Acetobacterium wieringae TaxID=52694 RepID=A0A1F2PII8_9FIRM|nr:hypothetical protein [Acetobacterium wieringae]OFV71149.1 hypothetical protein ACWI_17370 [Acetobacterium wieringae]TYC84179.1 hypothetical protein FXB42_12650 [Acetobacterium wieringae]